MLGLEPPVSALPHVRNGRIRAIAYTAEKRSPAAPDVPAIAESSPGFELLTWLGFWVPAKTPEAVVQRLHRELAAINAAPEMLKLIDDAGLEPARSTPAETAAIVKRDAQAMERLIKARGITLE